MKYNTTLTLGCSHTKRIKSNWDRYKISQNDKRHTNLQMENTKNCSHQVKQYENNITYQAFWFCFTLFFSMFEENFWSALASASCFSLSRLDSILPRKNEKIMKSAPNTSKAITSVDQPDSQRHRTTTHKTASQINAISFLLPKKNRELGRTKCALDGRKNTELHPSHRLGLCAHMPLMYAKELKQAPSLTLWLSGSLRPMKQKKTIKMSPFFSNDTFMHS